MYICIKFYIFYWLMYEIECITDIFFSPQQNTPKTVRSGEYEKIIENYLLGRSDQHVKHTLHLLTIVIRITKKLIKTKTKRNHPIHI